MEKERGSYFIQPFLVAIPPSAQSYKGLIGDATIETEIGVFYHLEGDDNLEGEIHFGYLNSNYGEISIPGTRFP